MSITKPVNVEIVSSVRRTFQLHINCDLGTDWAISAMRETVGLDATGKVQVRTVDALHPVRRTLSQLADEYPVVCTDGTTITISHMMEAMAEFIDRWETKLESPGN